MLKNVRSRRHDTEAQGGKASSLTAAAAYLTFAGGWPPSWRLAGWRTGVAGFTTSLGFGIKLEPIIRERVPFLTGLGLPGLGLPGLGLPDALHHRFQQSPGSLRMLHGKGTENPRHEQQTAQISLGRNCC